MATLPPRTVPLAWDRMKYASGATCGAPEGILTGDSVGASDAGVVGAPVVGSSWGDRVGPSVAA